MSTTKQPVQQQQQYVTTLKQTTLVTVFLWSRRKTEEPKESSKFFDFKITDTIQKSVSFSNEKLNIGIGQDQLRTIGGIFHCLFGNQYLLSFKVHSFKYNVVGKEWYSHYQLLCDVYSSLTGLIDDVSKKHRELGLLLPVNLNTVMNDLVFLNNATNDCCKWKDIFQSLTNDNDTIIRFLKQSIEIVGSQGMREIEDFLIDAVRCHEKIGWKLRAVLVDDDSASVS